MEEKKNDKLLAKINAIVYTALSELAEIHRPLCRGIGSDVFAESHGSDVAYDILRIAQEAARKKLSQRRLNSKKEAENAAYSAIVDFVRKARADGRIGKGQRSATVVRAWMLAGNFVKR